MLGLENEFLAMAPTWLVGGPIDRIPLSVSIVRK
jgi:hypothetical protein